jgi:hypothetical protein
MRTPKQIAASRANGAKSKGPVTDQGKLNSSRNSTRHGIFAETIVLETEDTPAFLELIEDLYSEHDPRTPTEMMLVDTIAAARWRQDRIFGMQKVAFDQDVDSGDEAVQSPPHRAVRAWRSSSDSVRTHELLLRYEIALDRQISRSLLRLHQLQDRRAAVQNAAPQAISPGNEETARVERTRQSPETKRTAPVPLTARRAPEASRDV